MRHSGAFIRTTGILVACALAGSLVGAATAGAASAGFHVWNLTGKPLRVNTIELKNGAAFDTSEDAPVRPKVNDLLQPGVDSGRKFDHNHIELRRGSDEDALIFYAGANGYYSAGLNQSNAFGIPYHFATCTGPSTGLCKVDGSWAFFFDPPGTELQLDAADPQKQSDSLLQLCTNANVKEMKFVKCEFDPTDRDTEAFGSPHVVGTLPNCLDREVEEDFEREDKVGTENSLGVKVSAETKEEFLFESVKVSIETEYKHKWLTETSFKRKLPLPVKSFHFGWVTSKTPVTRYTGDFTLTIGNTKIYVRNVHWESPDPDRAGEIQWVPHERPMTAQEKKDVCGKSKSAPRAPMRYATITQRGTKGANTLWGGGESTTLIARGGADILLGAAGDDSLFGGPGHDFYRAGPGADTIVDHRGRSRVLTGAGRRNAPDSVDVRDGEGDDAVRCGSRTALVRADPGDRLRHCGG